MAHLRTLTREIGLWLLDVVPTGMSRIDFDYDFRSPFAYFATQRMNLLTDVGAEITWRPI